VAWENVEMFNTQNERLETQEITFLQDSDLIYTDKFVTITTNSGIIRGIGLRSNQNFTKYRILKPTGDVYINEPTDTK
jgi:LPS export ABC transporter protein LptC